MPGGFNYKPSKSRSLKTPGGSGSNQLMAYMLSQQKAQDTQGIKQQEAQQNLSQIGPNAIATGGKIEGVDYINEQSRKTTADAQNQLNRVRQIKNVVKGVQELGNTLPTDLFSASVGTLGATKGYGRFGTEQHKTYLDALPTASAATYRAITGDNRLSDADASSRAVPLFWHPMEPETVRQGKNSFVNFMLDQAEKEITPGEPQDPNESLSRWNDFVTQSKQKFDAMQAKNSGQSNPLPENPLPGINKKNAYQVGQVVNVNGKNYTVVDISDPNDPDLEEIK